MSAKLKVGDKLFDRAFPHRTFEILKVGSSNHGSGLVYDLKILSTDFTFEKVGDIYNAQYIGAHLELLKPKEYLGHPLTKIFK
jgi:hypothetical protein